MPSAHACPRKLAKKIRLKPLEKGVYALPWGICDIRLIVTSRISRHKRNALWLMFSAVADKIKYGVTEYKGQLHEMSSTINQLLAKYRNERIIVMPYTIEDYREELKRNLLESLPIEERLEGLPAEERLKGLPAEERLKGLPAEELLKMLSLRDRLKGLSAEELLKVFSTEELTKILPIRDIVKRLSEDKIEQ